MKFSMASLLLATLALASVSSATSVDASVDLSPVSRVVELLKQLRGKVEEEMKTEDDLYKKFACWSTTVQSEKTASNEKAKARVETLEAYVADLDAGRIELTTERVDLEKEIEDLRSEIELAEAMRKKEHADYLAAKDELTGGIDALEEAIKVLKDATGYGPPDTSFLSLKQRAGSSEALSRAVDLSSHVLSKGDARFLQRLLSGEVPTWDWKKLNRKATFKSKYKARSGKIQDVLNALLFQFSSGLKEADYKEGQAVKKHEALMKDKKDQRDAAITALGKMEVEGFARGLSKDEANAEITALKEQIKNDTKYIKDAKDALDEKKKELKERKKLRMGEIEAISKAISVLHNDDARDLFKRSFESQGYFFMQLEQNKGQAVLSRVMAHGVATVRDAVTKVLKTTKDARIKDIIMRVSAATGGHFDAVISAIDKMITNLQDEEKEDLQNKEDCEKDRMDDTREAILASRAMDEMSDTITRLLGEIEELEAEIKEKEEQIKQIQKEMMAATKIRGEEHMAWRKNDKDDKEAAEVVGDAINVLDTFYKDNFGLLQQPLSKAGAAPPPPPPTWDEPYAGKKGEKTGIVSILGLVKEDIEKDRATAKTAEDASQKAYTDFMTESDAQIGKLNTEIGELEGVVAKKKGEVQTTRSDRLGKQKDLKLVIKKIQDAESGCDYITINFPMRSKNRAIETDGLKKAKAILKNATFADPDDPNRELKPGDALF